MNDTQDRLDLASLPHDQRVACAGALLHLASADGVIDDEEVLPLMSELSLGDVDEANRVRVARWLLEPPSLDEVLQPLVNAPAAVRFGLALRMVELVGADAFIAPGEVVRLTSAATALGVTDDQLGAMRGFVLDLQRVLDRGSDTAAWARTLEGAGGTLAAAGVPALALAFSTTARGLEGLESLAEGLGVPSLDDALGDADTRRTDRAEALERTRRGLDVLIVSLTAYEKVRADAGAGRRELALLALRRRAFERRSRALS